ncbi:energy-coupling factor ABC transporter ATP-binding protein [Anaerobranca gottschalkii]|uniref:Cobalt/nickel transport system ATP-binding protein n=1 Tax=Anaerobranca gottschalkii DSM 13577 TaxID=1120990 RepID=A0A1H9Y8Q3_9FIRM|nr:energy-coupling factor ABC transporter ATP-binding protein [Anaerobranca gottschalkii]SES65323.1 cobalt/nickel transport system ATP-binding protein [Anaerobranca gottschalkii DSM 13577]
MKSIIKAKDTVFIYPDKTKVELKGEFIVTKGERTTILGCNGSGKTTLYKGILGLMENVEGELLVLGIKPYKKFHTIRNRIGVVLQNTDEQIIAPTVYDDIALTLRNNSIPENEIKDRVDWILTELKLTGLAKKVPHYLSGGEKKKVILAGALVTNPEVLLLDEPFTGLDPRSKLSIVDMINHFCFAHGTTIVTTTHDMELVPDITDVTYVFSKGEILAKSKGVEVFQNFQLLDKANLVQPQLYQLFTRLIDMGLPINYPDNVEDGAEKIYTAYETKPSYIKNKNKIDYA